MSLSVLMISAVIGATPAADVGKSTPIRCRPAPYYVADHGEHAVLQRLSSGAQFERLRIDDKGVRACYLTKAKRNFVVNPAASA